MQFSENLFQRLKNAWLDLWKVNNYTPDTNIPVLIFRLFCLILVYMVFDKVFMRMSVLPPSVYEEPVIFWAFLKVFFASWYAIGLVLILLPMFFFYKRLIIPWSAFELGKYVRVLIVAAVFILAWAYSTYDFNLYYNQGHYIDRIGLLLFILLIFWRPVFVLPFLGVLIPVIGQFTVLIGFSWAAPFLPIRILILFNVFFIVFLFSKKFGTKDFVFLSGCLFAAHYWASGWGKFNLDWIRFDNIYYLLPATYANGWLAFLEAETIAIITQRMDSMNFLMKVFVLIVEAGAVLFFLHRKASLFFLGSWCLLHIGIFASSGICFWMWVFLDVVLFILFIKKDAFSTLHLYTLPRLIISVVLIAGGFFWCKPVKLAWFDVPLSYTYRFKATCESGAVHYLPPGFFAPYDYQFTLSSFSYLDLTPLYGITWGATGDHNIAKWLMKPNSVESIFEHEKLTGKIFQNDKKAAALDAFLKQYIFHWNKRFSKQTWASAFQAPRLLWTFPGSIASDAPDPIRRISVIQVTSLYKNDQYSEIRKKNVREVVIPQ